MAMLRHHLRRSAGADLGSVMVEGGVADVVKAVSGRESDEIPRSAVTGQGEGSAQFSRGRQRRYSRQSRPRQR